MLLKYLQKEMKFGAQNYKPYPIELVRGKGVHVWDSQGIKYLDFLAGYSSVNQGHCNSYIITKANVQMKSLCMTSRAFSNNVTGNYMEYICKTFNYDKVLPTNTGVEAGETAIKLARLYGYKNKGIESNKAVVLFAKQNFWGRSIAALSSSSDPMCYNHFGPYTPNLHQIPYNCVDSFKSYIKNNKNVVAFMVEPIQGEAGIIIPDRGYLKQIKGVCEEHNILLIVDEVQTGLGRTGKMLACEHDDVKPDILVLGKALSGGLMPVSAVLSNNNVMQYMKPNMHGSTFGGNPLGCAIAKASIEYTLNENLSEKSSIQGSYFRSQLAEMVKPFDFISDVRGKGLMNAIECVDDDIAEKLCTNLRNNGLLTKPTKLNTLRLTPPLIIGRSQLNSALHKINESMKAI
uniref:ornithine aminotransferase n=1 Tax=viral metagenome TaxID=1070528 RepID=A0A6C0JG28_9ZZZZ